MYLENKILDPSGDQDGVKSLTGPLVTLRRLLPSIFTTKMLLPVSECSSKVILSPRGDQLIVPGELTGVISVLFAPSSFIKHIAKPPEGHSQIKAIFVPSGDQVG